MGDVTPEEEDFENDREIITEFVADAQEHLGEAEAHLLKLEKDPVNREAMSALFRGFHTIKGLSGFLGFKGLETLAHNAEDLLTEPRAENTALPSASSDMIFEAVDHLNRMITDIHGALRSDAPMPRPEELAPELIVRIKTFLASDAVASARIEASPPESKPPRGADNTDLSGNESDKRKKTTPGQNNSIRVDADRLDKLVDTIGELVICESMFRRAASGHPGAVKNQDFARHVDRMDKITRALQETASSLRMVPLRTVFRKMARLVRDLSHETGKQVELIIEGEETELDKTIVERIADPLMHMVRNAIDHGLEPDTDARRAAGKPPSGVVTLRAFHKGSSILIEVEDDGRGLDTDRIYRRALKHGLISEDETLTEQKILQLISEPGFSTAEKVTSISGGGVGMDVVRQHIEEMNGSLGIRSKPGKGTCFSVRLPLTLAVIDGMVMRLGADRYVIPTLAVLRLIQPQRSEIHSPFDRGQVLHLGDELIPILHLKDVMQLTGVDRNQGLGIVVEADGVRVAIPADELLGQEQLVIKSFGEGLGDLPGIAGCTIMPDGAVGLVLDPAALIRRAQQSSPDRNDTAA